MKGVPEQAEVGLTTVPAVGVPEQGNVIVTLSKPISNEPLSPVPLNLIIEVAETDAIEAVIFVQTVTAVVGGAITGTVVIGLNVNPPSSESKTSNWSTPGLGAIYQ